MSEGTGRAETEETPTPVSDTGVEAEVGTEPGEPTPPAPEPPDAPEKLSPEQEILQLQAHMAELTDLHVRAVADLDNFRKRSRRETQEALRYTNATLLTDLLPVIDNFERALNSGTECSDGASLRQGVELILKQLMETLEKHGLSQIAALAQSFDPMRHEALGQVATDEAQPGCVVQEVRRGYCLYDRVVRASQVFVAAPPASEPEAEAKSD